MPRRKGDKNRTWRGKPIQTRDERFWAKVAKTDSCWVWTGSSINKQGYGSFRDSDRMRSAHRVAWELAYGPLDRNENVLHKCDNPKCVRLEHLFLGTQTDNMRDMAKKGRAGKAKPAAKLELQDVTEIRIKLRSGDRVAALAAEYGLSLTSIYNIRSGRTWNESF